MAIPLAAVGALAAASAVGGGLQAYGQYKSAQEAAKAQKATAEANKAYAQDILKQQQAL